jgi:hypothetical protein
MMKIIRAVWPHSRERLVLRDALLAGAVVGAILLVNGLLALLVLQLFAWLEELEAGTGVLPIVPVGAGFRGAWRRSPLSSVPGLCPGKGRGTRGARSDEAACAPRGRALTA